MLKNEAIAEFGVDTAENEPSKVWVTNQTRTPNLCAPLGQLNSPRVRLLVRPGRPINYVIVGDLARLLTLGEIAAAIRPVPLLRRGRALLRFSAPSHVQMPHPCRRCPLVCCLADGVSHYYHY